MNLPTVAEVEQPAEQALRSRLQRALGNRVRDLRVLIRPEGVVLRGRTTTYHHKQVAQHAVMDLAGLPILANEIEVA